jgi:hypothetical protein
MIEQLMVELLTPAIDTNPGLAAPAEEPSVVAVSDGPNRGAALVDFENRVVFLQSDHFPYNTPSR